MSKNNLMISPNLKSLISFLRSCKDGFYLFLSGYRLFQLVLPAATLINDTSISSASKSNKNEPFWKGFKKFKNIAFSFFALFQHNTFQLIIFSLSAAISLSVVVLTGMTGLPFILAITDAISVFFLYFHDAIIYSFNNKKLNDILIERDMIMAFEALDEKTKVMEQRLTEDKVLNIENEDNELNKLKEAYSNGYRNKRVKFFQTPILKPLVIGVSSLFIYITYSYISYILALSVFSFPAFTVLLISSAALLYSTCREFYKIERKKEKALHDIEIIRRNQNIYYDTAEDLREILNEKKARCAVIQQLYELKYEYNPKIDSDKISLDDMQLNTDLFNVLCLEYKKKLFNEKLDSDAKSFIKEFTNYIDIRNAFYEIYYAFNPEEKKAWKARKINRENVSLKIESFKVLTWEMIVKLKFGEKGLSKKYQSMEKEIDEIADSLVTIAIKYNDSNADIDKIEDESVLHINRIDLKQFDTHRCRH